MAREHIYKGPGWFRGNRSSANGHNPCARRYASVHFVSGALDPRPLIFCACKVSLAEILPHSRQGMMFFERCGSERKPHSRAGEVYMRAKLPLVSIFAAIVAAVVLAALPATAESTWDQANSEGHSLTD
jgi:hypothetical protein